jgi:serine protease Do
MLQGVSHKFRSACMMLARSQAGSIAFLGSAFLVHRGGYLLTAAHLTTDDTDLVVVPTTSGDDFSPMTFDRVAGMPVTVRQSDVDHDVALLYIEQDITIGVPDDFLGATSAVRPGASVMSLGYSFGHQQVHSLLGFNAIVSAKIRSRNDTALILYDSAFHEGDRGGPLVHVADGHIIGIVSGRFEPAEIAAQSAQQGKQLEARETNVSYAVAIEYGLELLRSEGLLTEHYGPA